MKTIDRNQILDALDGLHAYHLLAMHWAYAVHDRLQGLAAFLLHDELEALADENLKAARTIAAHVADLDGAVTADPRQLVKRSPLADFQLPRSFGDIQQILGYALEQVDIVVREYKDLAERVRSHDDLTHRLVVKLLGSQVHRQADLRAALAHD